MAKTSAAPAVRNRYEAIIEKIFQRHHEKGATQFAFNRDEIEAVAKQLKIVLPKNLGDLIYSFRYRTHLPETIRNTAAKGSEWIIEPAGRAKYQFKQVKINRILPRPELITIKVPDATPEIVIGYAQGDEQALLAKVRYNRLSIFSLVSRRTRYRTIYARQSKTSARLKSMSCMLDWTAMATTT